MITIASQTIKHIWAPILSLILLIIIITSTLLYGIKIEQLSIAGVSVEKLYIKLDKKLIVEIDKITINKDSDESNSKQKLIDAIKYYPYLNKFFSSIFINELHYTNELISFAYTQNSFFLDSKYLIFDIAIETDNDTNIKANINELALKDIDFTLYGTILGNIKQNALALDGTVKTYNITGSIQLSIEDMLLNYKLKTEKSDIIKQVRER